MSAAARDTRAGLSPNSDRISRIWHWLIPSMATACAEIDGASFRRPKIGLAEMIPGSFCWRTQLSTRAYGAGLYPRHTKSASQAGQQSAAPDANALGSVVRAGLASSRR